MITASLLCATLWTGICQTPPVANPPAETDRLLGLLETITNIDGGQSISSDNSQVIVNTSGIDKIVKMGPKVVPDLVRIMKCETITFDTFTRCYSACDQILRAIDPKVRVFWTGGSNLKKIGGVRRIFSGGHEDELGFRRAVVKSIEAQFQRLKAKKTDRGIYPMNSLVPADRLHDY
ncbi:MAG: hypothetical protein U0793_12855 [Gemmataceae bacterium]